MKSRLALVFLGFIAGCNSQSPGPEAQLETDHKNSASARLELIKQAEQFKNDLNQLTELAQQKENKSQYNQAADVRNQIRDLITQNLGESSWQAFNAVVAHKRAIFKSNFTASQLEQDQHIKHLVQTQSELMNQKAWNQAVEIGRDLVLKIEELFGDESIDAAQAWFHLASLESRIAQYSESIKHYHTAIELFRKNQLPDHPEMEMAHAGLAAAYTKLAKLTPAAANQKEATRIAGQLWGRESLAFATQANQLGVIFHRANNLEVAFEILDRAKNIREAELGTDHVAYAHSCLNLGVLMLDLKRTDNAEEHLKQALTIFERDFGTDQELTNRAKSSLATIYMLRKQPELAAPLLKDVVDAMAADSDDKLTHQYRLSIAYAKQGKYDLAKPVMESVYREQTKRFGQSDSRTVTTMRAYALLLERTHQTDDANKIKNHIERVAHQVDTNDFQKRY